MPRSFRMTELVALSVFPRQCLSWRRRCGASCTPFRCWPTVVSGIPKSHGGAAGQCVGRSTTESAVTTRAATICSCVTADKPVGNSENEEPLEEAKILTPRQFPVGLEFVKNLYRL